MQFLNLIPSDGTSLPLPTDLAQANLAFAALAETPAADALNAAIADDKGRALLEGAFDGSPYLARAAEKAPQAFIDCLNIGPDAAFAEVITTLESVASASSQPAAMATLRQAKLGGALIIGLADLASIWTLEQVTGAVSELARRSVDAALGWLLADAAKRNVFLTDDPTGETLLRHGGLIVLGMGKLGAEELNYSSDIDLIVLFDPEKIEAKRPDRLQHEMVRLTRGLVTMMEELTRDGYVFRTDLRLRPDPASTPMALSVDAAEVYYESAGQNWERAAMIKARPIAGDLAAGAAFMKGLRPFVWRRSLDFNAIRDIQSIKRQIDRKQGGEPPSAFDQNVKLGRGGIREIEFFAQTQQLIWGGRDTSLRDCGTLPALKALVQAGHVTAAVQADLKAAYIKLRTIEHRLQMVDDRQTHMTPEADEAYAFARFAGYETTEVFASDLVQTLQTVESHYADLFADEEDLGGGRALSFTGADHHPDTLATLTEMGFEDAKRVAETIKGWHHGRIRAMRTGRAREILTELTPDLLARFGAAPDADVAFNAFAEFLAGLPSGVQIFSLFEANRGLLDFLARVLCRSPYLATHISEHPHVLDAVLRDEFMAPPGDKDSLREDLSFDLGDAIDFQDVLDGARRWLSEIRLRLSVQTLETRLAPITAAGILSDAADVVAERMLVGVQAEFEATHGLIEGGSYGVLAYGKWGSRELTIGSDLDLVAIYEAPDGVESDGARSLAPAVYYMRLTQRLITALTAQTGEGRLFEVDMRLRPTGDDGPIATHINSLARYLTEDAWTWELMALTRARFTAGDSALAERFDAVRGEMMAKTRERAVHLSDVASMRSRIESAKGAGGPWDVKLRQGGMVDAEFIGQGLALLYGGDPSIRAARAPAETFAALNVLGGMGDDRAAVLSDAASFWLSCQWVMRLLGPIGSEEADPADDRLKAEMAAALGYDDVSAMEVARDTLAAAVSAAYLEIYSGANI
jgi:glutamate-ammonia-ligase adenylyltransferase